MENTYLAYRQNNTIMSMNNSINVVQIWNFCIKYLHLLEEEKWGKYI